MRPASLRAKFLWGTVLVLALMMGAVAVVVDQRQHATIVGEVEQRGTVLARSLAAMSYGPLLLYNFTALEQNVARVAAETDVVYAVVLAADGRIAAHSRQPERVGEVFAPPPASRRRPAIPPATSRCPCWWAASSGGRRTSGCRASGWTPRSSRRGSSWAP